MLTNSPSLAFGCKFNLSGFIENPYALDSFWSKYNEINLSLVLNNLNDFVPLEFITIFPKSQLKEANSILS